MARIVGKILAFLAFLVIALAVVAVVVVPMVVRPIVIDAVRAASPFGAAPLDVEVDLNALGLLRGKVDRIHVHGAKLVTGDTTIGALDLTVTGVSTTDRGFEAITGRLSTLSVPWVEGSTITIDGIDLVGQSGAVVASATLDAKAGVALVGAAFGDAGVPVDDIELADGGVTLVVLGHQVELALEVQDGALVLPDVLGGGPVTLLEPGPDDPWRLTGVSVTAAGMVIEGVLDAQRVLAGG